MIDFDRVNDNWKMYEGNPREEEEDVEVCVYCGDERNNRFQCCSETHWVKRSEF